MSASSGKSGNGKSGLQRLCGAENQAEESHAEERERIKVKNVFQRTFHGQAKVHWKMEAEISSTRRGEAPKRETITSLHIRLTRVLFQTKPENHMQELALYKHVIVKTFPSQNCTEK